jgi:predicted secreted Zn-dependent protease
VGRALALGLSAFVAVGCYRTPGLDVGRVPVGVVVDSRLRYYDISAGSLQEIRRAIGRAGPHDQGRVWDAVTTWRFDWTYHVVRAGITGCEARRPTVRVRTEVLFPRWNPTADPDSALLAWWQQYNAGLMEHERGHALLAVEGAGKLAKELDGLEAPCEQLGQAVSTIAQRHINAVSRSQVEYDFTTRHGVTQIQAARRLQEP